MQSPSVADFKDPRDLQLFEAVRNILSKQNHLSEMRAKIRADIVHILQGSATTEEENRGKNHSNRVQDWLNTLIVEYLDWCGFRYTKDVFLLESGTRDDLIGFKLAQGDTVQADDTVPTLVDIIIRTINERENSV